MREIKFRAWDQYTHKMIETGFHIIGEITMFKVIDQYLDENPYPDGTQRLLRFNDVVLELWTGLHDKNGTEIYVGDIIKLAEYMGKEAIVDVRFDGLCITAGNLLTGPTTFETSEIIGNIHENPELLK